MGPRQDEPLIGSPLAESSLDADLRARLARKTPPVDFTAGVLLRVRQETRGGSPPAARAGKPPGPGWAWAGVLAAALAAAVFISREAAPLAQPPVNEPEAQLLLSLQLAGKKLNKARDAVLRRPRTNRSLGEGR